MAKTAIEVQLDIIELLKDSILANAITGGIYHKGLRPRDSKLEDLIVIFTTGLPNQIQEGIVTLNLYVQDIDPYNNGVLVENMARTSELEKLVQSWFKSVDVENKFNYGFWQTQTIYTEKEIDTPQHFIVAKFMYRYIGEIPTIE